jgi:hypothetical protein
MKFASWPLEKDDSVHPKHRGLATARRNGGHTDRVVARVGIDRVDVIKMDVDAA